MGAIASPFLVDYAEETTVRPWLQQLKNFRSNRPGTTLDWTIPLDRPLRTKLSTGHYEPGGSGEHSVFAALSWIWQIKVPEAAGPTPKKGTLQSRFAVVGKASTRISVFANLAAGDARELARWRFEIGDVQAPGCHFHAQILGEKNDAMFPKSMPVPRLPNILVTPMDALEFVLAELFQEKWAEHVAKESDAMRAWAGCQKRRLIKLLRWQQDRLEKNSGSPWTSLKVAKPDATLLVEAS